VGDPLAALYPGMVRKVEEADAVSDAELLTSVRGKAEESARVRERFFAEEGEALVRMARGLCEVFAGGGRLLTMGNGGSSCDAAHLAVEFNHPITVGRPSLPAVHLGGDLAMVTAVGNDVGFASVFRRMVISQGREGDALFGFSTSGNSDNLMGAFEEGRRRGLVTFGFAGNDGGRMATSGLVDHCVVVRAPSVHRIQEAHLTAYHILWDLVHTLHAQHRDTGNRSDWATT
jgi:D-sedoheptulose 7-phosphate isomerase